MKTLIIYMSTHHGNTEKVARKMAKALGADLMKPGEVADPLIVRKYDLVGFGSGIYFGRFHRAMFELVSKMRDMGGKKAFTFSTGGAPEDNFANRFGIPEFPKKLKEKGFDVVDGFFCLGFDTYGYLALIGGLNKGRPDEKDLKAAEAFARGLKKKVI